jgi:hypothetical protein
MKTTFYNYFSGKKIIISGIILLILVVGFYYLQTNTAIPMGNLTQKFISTDGKFSFDYPVFEMWDAKVESNKIVYYGRLNTSAGVSAYRPQILILENPVDSKEQAALKKHPVEINPNGAAYNITQMRDNGNTVITFHLANSPAGSIIEISIPMRGPGSGFSGTLILDTILKSFKK